jgi:hypothetical protein
MDQYERTCDLLSLLEGIYTELWFKIAQRLLTIIL